MKRNTFAVMAAVLFSMTAIAAPPPKLDPKMKIPGVSAAVAEELAVVARAKLVDGINQLERVVNIRKPNPTDAELQCLAFTFARVTAQAAVLIDELWSAKKGIKVDMVRKGELQAAAKHYGSLEDQWCNGGGGKTSRVDRFLKAYHNANAPQARVSTGPKVPVREVPAMRAWFDFLRLGILVPAAGAAEAAAGTIMLPIIDPRAYMKREADPYQPM